MTSLRSPVERLLKIEVVHSVFTLFKETFSGWREHNAPRLGAALAYYAIFSVAPLLIIVVAIVGLAFGELEAQERIVYQAQTLVGERGAAAIRTLLEGTQKPGEGVIASVIGIGTLLLGASGVIGALREALNTIWEATPRPHRGIESLLILLKARFLLVAMVLGIGLLLLFSLVISAGITALGEVLVGIFPMPLFLLEVLNSTFLFIVIALLCTIIYKVLPDTYILWGDVWIGAALTALLFTIGKFLIGIYLGTSAVGSAYGAAGTFLVILVWVYYSAQILFFGAEFTRVYAEKHGSRRTPPVGSLTVSESQPAERSIASLTR